MSGRFEKNWPIPVRSSPCPLCCSRCARRMCSTCISLVFFFGTPSARGSAGPWVSRSALLPCWSSTALSSARSLSARRFPSVFSCSFFARRFSNSPSRSRTSRPWTSRYLVFLSYPLRLSLLLQPGYTRTAHTHEPCLPVRPLSEVTVWTLQVSSWIRLPPIQSRNSLKFPLPQLLTSAFAVISALYNN